MMNYWRNLSTEARIDVDHLIAGLHNVELLEGMSKYAHCTGLYFPRVVAALKQLPQKHWDAALAVFGSVIYVPRTFLSASMQYLWWAVHASAESRGSRLSEGGDDILVTEVDQDGLGPEFARLNGLSARLNGSVHPRLGDVQRFRYALFDVLNGTGQEQAHASAQLRLASSKKAWLILTDKALSGQSLLGDLQKITYARDLVAEATGCRPDIYVVAQISTVTAENEVTGWVQSESVEGITFLSAVRLDGRAQVGSPECRLFNSETHQLVISLCEWFDKEIVSQDLSLATFRERSSGSLALGYRNTGITLVDYRNTPTNSLPLLWFNSRDPDAQYKPGVSRPKYVGPFPRVHSRRGKEDSRWSESTLWKEILRPSARETILDRLSS